MVMRYKFSLLPTASYIASAPVIHFLVLERLESSTHSSAPNVGLDITNVLLVLILAALVEDSVNTLVRRDLTEMVIIIVARLEPIYII